MGSVKGEPRGTQTLARGLALLEKVGEGVHTLEGLARALGVPKSTAHRLARALVQAGYLRHQPRRGYALGPKLIRLGFQAHAQQELLLLARPHLEWLRDRTGETVHLGVLEGGEVVYVDKLPGRRELQLASRVGSRFPAQSTALGKALLAHLPEEVWARHFVPGLRRTPRTIGDLEAFREELRCTRARGYALDLEENEVGVRCVAAPIRDGQGQVVAAVSVSTAAVYLDEARIQEVAPLVQEAARRISAELGA
ncbi:IclR family transcriptional regulator [Thermus oshimai]|jgi:DNA-binding IclR family transcriptional regulator|uniref:Transcriptional regulator n=1 Tax=Thermus oshimai JL-2 TaxID=751945 RepID=K7QWW9_THEOS|nr:IclR family transcriptional regulator [Thermus oshimai]AFV77381.1 transcriptional regulator [Thermus oshimai JL-2]